VGSTRPAVPSRDVGRPAMRGHSQLNSTCTDGKRVLTGRSSPAAGEAARGRPQPRLPHRRAKASGPLALFGPSSGPGDDADGWRGNGENHVRVAVLHAAGNDVMAAVAVRVPGVTTWRVCATRSG
jgi:hypothetical protein